MPAVRILIPIAFLAAAVAGCAGMPAGGLARTSTETDQTAAPAETAPTPGPRGTLLLANRNAYAPGDTLVLTLTAGRARVIYNLCHALLYRFDAGAWELYRGQSRFVDVKPLGYGDQPFYFCTDAGYVAEPGHQGSYAIRLDTSLIAGYYRYEATPIVTPRDTTQERVVTGVFEIIR